MKGFSNTIDRKSVIKSMCQRPKFKAHNIHETVQQQRQAWDKKYLDKDRIGPSATWEQVFEKVEGYVDTKDSIVSTAKGFETHHYLFTGFKGYWHLNCFTEHGKNDFMFGVNTGDKWVFHPKEARMIVESHIGPEGYYEWVDAVKKDFKESSEWLMSEFKKVMPHWTSASITCCESSERLMAQVPEITVRNGVAFMVY